MFLPVFVHPGKRGPSPVKKSPEKSTAKGGPPAPPSATSSAHPESPSPLILVPWSPAAAPTTPPASRMHVSPCTLSLRVKKYLRPPARARPPARPPGRFFPHTCVKASRPHTHTRAHTHVRVCTRIHTRICPSTRAWRIYSRARGGDVRAV